MGNKSVEREDFLVAGVLSCKQGITKKECNDLQDSGRQAECVLTSPMSQCTADCGHEVQTSEAQGYQHANITQGHLAKASMLMPSLSKSH